MILSDLSLNYHEYLKTHPDLFYKSCCVFINQEIKLSPDWPDVKRLAQFICKSIEPNNFRNIQEFDDWEIQFDYKSKDLSGAFKDLAHWFSVGQSDQSFIKNIKYQDFITDGASFVEQCFAIWANVVEIDSGWSPTRNMLLTE